MLIASGASAEIFEFGAGRVLKLFRADYAFLADTEEQRARAVHEAGIASPAVLGRAEIDARPAIIFEHVRGPTLLAEQLPIEQKASALASVHVAMHARTAPGLPTWLAVVGPVASMLAQAERDRFLRHLERVPGGDRLYHGDFHPGNVIRGERGFVTVDWPNACLAHPAADVARSFVLLAHQGLGAAASTRWIDARRALATTYVGAYIAASGGVGRAEIVACLPLAAEGVLRAEPANPLASELAQIAAGDTDLAFA